MPRRSEAGKEGNEHYIPKMERSSGWNASIESIRNVDDDGHAAELLRALAHGQGI